MYLTFRFRMEYYLIRPYFNENNRNRWIKLIVNEIQIPDTITHLRQSVANKPVE